KSIPPCIIDPLDGSGCHYKTPPPPRKNGQRRRTTRNRYSLRYRHPRYHAVPTASERSRELSGSSPICDRAIVPGALGSSPWTRLASTTCSQSSVATTAHAHRSTTTGGFGERATASTPSRRQGGSPT